VVSAASDGMRMGEIEVERKRNAIDQAPLFSLSFLPLSPSAAIYADLHRSNARRRLDAYGDIAVA